MQRAGLLIRRHARLIAVILLLLLVFAVFEWSGLRAQFTPAFLQQTIRAHLVSGFLIFILVFTLGNLIQIPGWIFLAAAVLALGQLWGGIATYIAACIACFVVFFAIRWLGGNALRKLEHPLASRMLRHLDAHPVRSVLLLRILFQTMPALNYTLAMSGVRFRDYAIGTLLGLPLPIAVYCVFFELLARILHIA